MAGEEGEPIPVRPQSPFVSNLRLQVALSREELPAEAAEQKPAKQQWAHRPSVGTWHSPRSPRDTRGRPGGASVNFAAENEVVLISHRGARKADRRLLELQFKGTCAKPFKLENVDADLTVRNLKELCEAKCAMSPDQMRILHKGVILQDAQRLQDTNLPDRATLFMVKGAPTSVDVEEQVEVPSASDINEEEQAEAQYHIAMLCIECGVNPGRLLTDGLCSICFRELVVRENAALKQRREDAKIREAEALRLAEERQKEAEETEANRQKNTTRCYKCGKKTGLMGFQCKCGYYYCAAHRHAEEHDCPFDHKAHGRQILAQQNQKVENNSWE